MELENLLTKLKMDHLETQIDAVCEHAVQRQMDYKAFLSQALEAEWQGRYQRGIEARLRQARFPWIKILDQFDFDFQPSIDRRQVRELAGMSFAERSHNVIIAGPKDRKQGFPWYRFIGPTITTLRSKDHNIQYLTS